MNYSTAVMLFNPNIRAVKVTYEVDVDGRPANRYTFKTLDHTIKVGDYVVIPTDTRHKMTVAKVAEADVEIDHESDMEIKWILDKVDVPAADHVAAEEAKWIAAIKAGEVRRKREQIKKNMQELYAEEGIDKLPIANMGGETQLPKPE